MFTFLTLSLIIIPFVHSQQQNCTLPPWQDAFIFTDKNYGIRYYSNINLSSNTQIISKPTKAIIVIHGGDRDADDYYCAIFHSAQLQGYTVTNNDIIIIAPRFMESKDNPKSNELYWSSNSDIGWRGCGNSLVPTNTQNQVSSCTVIDSIISLLFIQRKNLYPNLQNVTIAGHSAGGQFTQRYALTTPLILDQTKYSMKYVPANPSSFCYLDSRRWFNDEVYRELTHEEINNCPGYNTWKYGWGTDSKFPPYISNQNLTLDIVKQRYILKNITYLHGTNDVCNEDINSTCKDGGMDRSCEGDLQGIFRLERGINYVRSLMEIFGKAIHRMDFVPFVGHDHVDMFQHPNGRRAIF